LNSPDPELQLGRRERQIVDAVYRLRKAGVAEIRAELPDPPTYSSVRAMLRLLEEKGYVRRERDGIRFVYSAAIGERKAGRSALRRLVSTFFRGSTAAAAAALLELPETRMSNVEKERLTELIRGFRTEGR
jgi:predicted transcriptional regulator